MPEPISSAASTVGSRVRERRQRVGITQETLAELAGLHWTFIGQVERGTRNLSLHNLIKIADGLGADPADLVAGLTAADVPPSDNAQKESDADRIRRERKAAS
jgi:transcriptional regulator with XRE-family HTH domain